MHKIKILKENRLDKNTFIIITTIIIKDELPEVAAVKFHSFVR